MQQPDGWDREPWFSMYFIIDLQKARLCGYQMLIPPGDYGIKDFSIALLFRNDGKYMVIATA
jgi:hypothetical protein